jgi:hypothetical protein
MLIEKSLGPLWEYPPKVHGFMVAISQPEALWRHCLNVTSSQDNMTGSQRDNLHRDSLVHSGVFFGSLEASLPFHDGFMQTMSLHLEPTVSQTYGRIVDMTCFVQLAPQYRFTPVVNREEFVRSLVFKRFSVRMEKDDEGYVVHLNLFRKKARIFLGYESAQEGVDAGVGLHAYGDVNDELVISMGNGQDIPLVHETFIQSLSFFQYATSHILDSLYTVAGFQPPDVLLQFPAHGSK